MCMMVNIRKDKRQKAKAHLWQVMVQPFNSAFFFFVFLVSFSFVCHFSKHHWCLCVVGVSQQSHKASWLVVGDTQETQRWARHGKSRFVDGCLWFSWWCMVWNDSEVVFVVCVDDKATTHKSLQDTERKRRRKERWLREGVEREKGQVRKGKGDIWLILPVVICLC